MSENWNETLNSIVSKFKAQVGMIHRLDPKDNHLYLIAYTKGFPEELINAVRSAPLGKGIAGNTAQSKKPIVFNNLPQTESPVIRPMAKTIGVMGMACVPVFHGEEVVGTLGLGCFDEHQFDEREVNELIAVGKKLSSKLLEYK